MRYVVTGGTGFIGRRVVSRLLESRPDAQVWVLVRRRSLGRFERLAARWGDRVKPLVAELPELDLSDEVLAELGEIDHVVHCAAIYDITAGEPEQRAANVEGTRAVIGLARRLGATMHHVSSIAVAGDFRGEYTEDDFDVGQQLPTPYHQTKFEAELLVRSTPGLRHRIYRPAVVVGDSRTGEMDKVDGPYYFFGVLAKLAVLPSLTPILLPDTGRTNIVPVDYVVDALVALLHADGRDGQTFHLTAEKTIGLRGIYRGVAKAAGLPPLRGSLPRSVAAPVLNVRGRARVLRNMAATQLGIPAEVFDLVDLPPTFVSEKTRNALRDYGIRVPEFSSYAPKLWRYWAEHLDPDRARRDDPRGPLHGRHVIITGASSGIGRASAIAIAERGATVFALARNGAALDELVAEIRANGGAAHAFTCDVTDSASVEHTVKDILGRFDHVDYLVNNAGRSIRRSVVNSTDRLHDYERVMAVNYFGAVRMVLALLPHWRERRFGHVVNVSSAGVQARNPKYSSYLPTKAALDAFSDVVGSEVLSDHITFTNIHMPLVRTPMIVPSHRLNPVRAISPERAAAMVVRGLVDKPARIDTPLGTLAEAGNYFVPRTSRRILHQLYLGYPDSAAARGLAPAAQAPPPAVRRKPNRPVRAVTGGLRTPRGVKRLVRRVPGVHW
ncbi:MULTISPECIES: SDR family oxidoreductase [Mycobacterium]|uniref:Short chain dehydrogenase family protein n=2 Tax=Mycobacterium avium complex (MAC) TaxID=120793 RepID=X8CB13_MYCIT|nr:MULTISPECIES: SDR family oxidoreductase [Mycobacterium]EUA52981.1 short chain dehydrogenase family protein [Mycobacterium intracellulare 1956]EUA28367.1 short chain dehydrogenase family protein [Mycobacterium intracellulare]MCA2307064.1 SDR family oxidoreductase [Mycobacterium intracellulare]MCA2349070.1 SDR family oxidoreductase [Mycobacterium intracellulare]OCB26565.1 short chain dehydrogenase [Mycobacterium intracellulare subsp. yongonense]